MSLVEFVEIYTLSKFFPLNYSKMALPCAVISNVAGWSLPAGEVYVSDQRTLTLHSAQTTDRERHQFQLVLWVIGGRQMDSVLQ